MEIPYSLTGESLRIYPNTNDNKQCKITANFSGVYIPLLAYTHTLSDVSYCRDFSGRFPASAAVLTFGQKPRDTGSGDSNIWREYGEKERMHAFRDLIVTDRAYYMRLVQIVREKMVFKQSKFQVR